MPLVKFLDHVKRAPLHLVGNARGVGQKEDGVAGFAEGHALVEGGQESAAVERGAAAESAGGVEHDKARQILRLAAESVEYPGAKSGTAKLGGAGLHEDLPGGMVEGVGGHGLHDGNVIHYFGQVRQRFGKLRAGLAVLRKLE